MAGMAADRLCPRCVVVNFCSEQKVRGSRGACLENTVFIHIYN